MVVPVPDNNSKEQTHADPKAGIYMGSVYVCVCVCGLRSTGKTGDLPAFQAWQPSAVLEMLLS